MSRLARPASYLMIEDQLDALGQRYRIQRLVRGTMLWVVWAVAASFAGAILADCIAAAAGGPSAFLTVVLALWAVWLVLSFGLWILRPLLLRPAALEVARLVETRVGGLHNGLTNSVLLAGRDDLANSPWLEVIFDEIAGNARSKSLDDAVKFADLRPLAIRMMAVIFPVLILAFVPAISRMLTHGWSQMLHPGVFVPKVGLVHTLEVQPGDITLVAGQPLEVSIIARGLSGEQSPDAKLIFDDAKKPAAMLSGTPLTEADASASGDRGRAMRYTYRVEHIDVPVKYRVEVAGTQSPWFAVTVVRQVKLKQMVLDITPPVYTRLPAVHLALKPEELARTPVVVPQGSRVELTAEVDVPVKAGMLQADAAAPTPMTVSLGGERFTGDLTLMQDTDVAVLLAEGAGQIIATLPDSKSLSDGKWTIRVTKDAPPAIEMKWPTQDTAVAPNAEVKLSALLRDDYGISSAVVMMSSGDAPLAPVATLKFDGAATQPSGGMAIPLEQVLVIKPELRKHGNSFRVQLTATDNRDLGRLLKDGGPQTTSSQIYEIKFRDPEQIAKEEKEKTDKLRVRLMELLKQQQDLLAQTMPFQPTPAGKGLMAKVNAGQVDLVARMRNTVETFEFDEQSRIVQKTLMVLAVNPAKEAVDLSAAIGSEPVAKEQVKLTGELESRQRRIIATLESLLALLNASPEPATQPTTRESGQIPSKVAEMEKLNEALKQFLKEEQRILDQTASLAKKPVDNFDDRDKKLMEELKMAQDKMDAFMEQTLSDFSKNAEQDMSNAALLKDLMSVYSEVTMAKDALNKQATEIAVADEEMGLENAKELQSNIEKWLMNKPDRENWQQEDPTVKNDTPMPELPKELEDMVGELMEQQEDLFQQMEDANANWTDSMDKGVGWDAADGPIADMSAKGVTGNQLPNDNEMAGRSGEGRQGKSQGEFVGDTAQGKGGRNTPTRLDPTPFAKGQIKDESKDPTGGATGGGKLSGQGGQGLEGPLAPKMKEQMQRVADKQAELRNNAERLNLQYKLGKYDNFKLLDSVAFMRGVESDLKANRYQQAMRRKDVLLDNLDTSRMLLDGRVHVQRDTTPAGNAKLQEDINDAMKGAMPAAWTEALKEYYKKLGSE